MSERELEYVVENSSLKYCQLKTLEELFELGECITKQLTKPKGANDPKRIQHISEEMGDVILNIMGLAKKMGILDEVEERIDYKLKKCVERVDKQLNKV